MRVPDVPVCCAIHLLLAAFCAMQGLFPSAPYPHDHFYPACFVSFNIVLTDATLQYAPPARSGRGRGIRFFFTLQQ